MINDVTDVAAVGVEITYDPSVITVTDVSNYFPHPISNIDAEEGWVRIGGYKGGEGLSGDIKPAELTIAPTGNYGKISALAIDVDELQVRTYKTIDADVIDGFFYIGVNGDVNADRVINSDDSHYIASGIAGIPGYEKLR